MYAAKQHVWKISVFRSDPLNLDAFQEWKREKRIYAERYKE